jgi:hypothetical protein
MANPLQGLYDELIGGALNILRLAASQRKRTFARLAKLEKELIGKLAEADLSRYDKRVVNVVLKNANVSIAQAYADMPGLFDIVGLAKFAAEHTVSAFEITLGLEAIKLPKQAYFNALKDDAIVMGHPTKEWWKTQDADTQFKFAGQVRQGLIAAETNQQIIARIVGKSGQPGIMDAVRRNAATLVQTSVQSVASDARRKTFNANPETVKGIEQISTLDSHTSLTCVAYSHAKWNLDYEPIAPNELPYLTGVPRHMSCRSVEVPILKSFADLGIDIDEPKFGTTRASEDGQIDVDTTFDGFLKRKSKEYVDEMLGVGRADLWRAGKITLRDLVNGEGREQTLAELQELVAGRQSS